MSSSKKKKLFIDAMSIVDDRMSGIGHLTLALIKELAKDFSSDIEVIAVVPFEKKHKLAKYNFANVTIKTIPLPAKAVALISMLRRMLPIDVVLGKGVYLFTNYRNWPLRRSSRSLTYVHDVSFVLHPETVQPKNLSYLKKYIPQWIARTDKVITLTKASKEDIVNNLSVKPEKVAVVSCGVDHDLFYERDEKEIRRVKNKYSIKTKNYLLYVGNIEPRKNLINLLAAYEKLEPTIAKKFPLVIVGAGGWLSDDVADHIARLKERNLSVILPSEFVSDEDLPAVYSGAHLFVQPALYEGFGMPPIEAMACGTPVVASKIPVFQEVLGEAALMFDPLDPEDIAEKLMYLLNDPQLRERYIPLGLKKSREYTWEKAASQLAELVEGA